MKLKKNAKKTVFALHYIIEKYVHIPDVLVYMGPLPTFLPLCHVF